MTKIEEQVCRHIAGNPTAVTRVESVVHIMRYMDEITIATSAELADLAFITVKKSLDGCKHAPQYGHVHGMNVGWGNPKGPTTRQLWEQFQDHRGFVVCGLPATFVDPTTEAATPFPCGGEEFIKEFLEARKGALIETLNKCVEAATLATASLPVAQAYTCILRT
jgi:hypothetical protein